MGKLNPKQVENLAPTKMEMGFAWSSNPQDESLGYYASNSQVAVGKWV